MGFQAPAAAPFDRKAFVVYRTMWLADLVTVSAAIS